MTTRSLPCSPALAAGTSTICMPRRPGAASGSPSSTAASTPTTPTSRDSWRRGRTCSASAANSRKRTARRSRGSSRRDADNHVGIVGVAPRARLLALRACWQASADDTLCTSLGLAIALHTAIDQGAHVINLSLGGPADRLIGQLVTTALARGIDVVAAADRRAARGGFPAEVPGVVAVVDDDAGAVPPGMVGAPGTDVPTTLPGARWGVVSGASYAAAHVSGLLAVMRDVRSKSTTVGQGGSAADLVLLGDRRIDACASVRRAGAACLCDCSGRAEMAVSTTQR
jgi:subtilisin family serine protease